MTQPVSSRKFRDQIVGRTIAGVIARPGQHGEPPVVLMMRFDDGSVIEFVSPRSDRLLRRSLNQSVTARAPETVDWASPQLPLDGLVVAGSA
ncbi:MAG: hypothetical protein ACLFSC_01205 [Wenzhouxiangella sp.]